MKSTSVGEPVYAGLVTRESAAGDGRFTIYRLTEASLAMVQAVLAWQPRMED